MVGISLDRSSYQTTVSNVTSELQQTNCANNTTTLNENHREMGVTKLKRAHLGRLRKKFWYRHDYSMAAHQKNDSNTAFNSGSDHHGWKTQLGNTQMIKK
eukprot:6089742-Amphidinium_carterae.1